MKNFLKVVLLLVFVSAVAPASAQAGWWDDVKDWWDRTFGGRRRPPHSSTTTTTTTVALPPVTTTTTTTTTIPRRRRPPATTTTTTTTTVPEPREPVPVVDTRVPYLPEEALRDAFSGRLYLVGCGSGLNIVDSGRGLSCLARNGRVLVFSENSGPQGRRTAAVIHIISLARGQEVVISAESGEGRDSRGPRGRNMSGLGVGDYAERTFSVSARRLNQRLRLRMSFAAYLNAVNRGGYNPTICAIGGLNTPAPRCAPASREYQDNWARVGQQFLSSPPPEWQRLLADMERLAR